MAVEPDAIRRGAVVVVRMSGDKARPAVVVRSDLLAGLGYATVLLIASDPRPDFSPRTDLAPTAGNGLRTPSQIMVDWPQTVRLSAMGEVIGRLDRQPCEPSRVNWLPYWASGRASDGR